jgi:hypothetical protein
MGVGLPGDGKVKTLTRAQYTTPAVLDEEIWASGLFICGHPKSGTSLLMTMLDSHPELVVYPEESHFFRRFLPQVRSEANTDLILLAQENLLHIFEWNQINPPDHQEGYADRDYSAIDSQQIREHFLQLLQSHDLQLESVLPAAILSYGLVSGQVNSHTQRWVEKTPYNEQFADVIFSFWPNAKCLHIIRDPRDNYASYKKKQTEWQPEHFAYSWWRSFDAGRHNEIRFGKDRYRIIRYEDLVRSPEIKIKELTEFIGIHDDPILRRPTRAGGIWAGNSMFGDSFEKISAKPAGRYHDSLSEDAVARLEDLLRYDMRSLKYQVESKANLPTSFAGRMRRLRWKLGV